MAEKSLITQETVGMTDEGLPPVLQGRNNSTQQVSFLRARVKCTDQGLITKIGVLPRGAFIKSIKIYAMTDFEDVTATFGKEPHGNDYGDVGLTQSTDSNVYIPMEERDVPLEVENTIYMTRDKKSSKGDVEVIVEFYTNR
ncbi:hypothetical protein BHOIPH791_12390 [Bartonella henselae]|uniref:Uncharacterized protein n=2 Tax=Bartonella TaxID=773 RepID=A0A067W7J7_9HYPH|nr:MULTISPECIES: hypothetical protein [Bartonella]ATP12423.1 hypothetical protein BhenCHDE101_04535 [Bartonella henselae]ETS08608.1 hypothetical protein Q655_00878 [Bartonella henselae JK 51]ETS09155.1 hypothetical protein Q654_00925 [Bartonella henselae JK 50]KEC54841.1 hypothetical protein O9A_01032 [Bartonella koehlerae C-29]MDM9983739.1 hypothetical protein [Bartonella henselae]